LGTQIDLLSLGRGKRLDYASWLEKRTGGGEGKGRLILWVGAYGGGENLPQDQISTSWKIKPEDNEEDV